MYQILYHASTVAVLLPIILAYYRPLDFGPGFYTTPYIHQALDLAEKIKIRESISTAYISSYVSLPLETLKKSFLTMEFETADAQWLRFIFINRKPVVEKAHYEIVSGPVSDGLLDRVLEDYGRGKASLEDTLRDLHIKKDFAQISFHSLKAMSSLKFLGSTAV
jgi:hypothetical protein